MSTTETRTFTTSSESKEHDLAREFSFADRELAQCAAEVDDLFIEEGADLEAVPAGRYWMRVADHVNHLVNREYSEPHNLEYGQLLQMTALMPIGYLASKQAAVIGNIPVEQRTPADYDKRQRAVAVAARFYNSMTDYARGNDALTTSLLSDHASSVLSKTLDFPEAATRHHMSELVTGVQHEVANGYVMFNAIEARVATLEEDLQGADYVAFHRGNNGAMVDIKTSIKAIIHAGGNAADGWAVKNGKILIASQLTTEELNGKFCPSDALIQERSPIMKRMLADAMANPYLSFRPYETTSWK